jgi:hypothetical protein
MAIFGADSLDPVTIILDGQPIIDQATALYGEKPAFWGRYFKDPASAGVGGQYDPATETPVLRAAGIPLLAVARQTNRVGGTSADGAADAQGNSDAIEAAFGWNSISTAGNEALVFLDVEITGSASAAYFTGWSNGLIARSQARSGNKVTLVPCIYAGPVDNKTWTAVAASIAAGARCDAVWACRYNNPGTGCHPPPAWDNTGRLALPAGVNCPVAAWQYDAGCHANAAGAGGFDMSIANPNLANLQSYFLDRLITP